MTTAVKNAASKDHRILTFYTGPRLQEYYLFNLPGGKTNPGTGTGTTSFTLTRLTESRLSGCTPTHNLSITAFSTDGSFVVPTPESPARRLEFVGDSITAGDLNDGGENTGGSADTVCANSAFNDDITFSSGGILCSSQLGFNAECMYTAWGGITLGVGKDAHYGMAELYPYSFSGLGPSISTGQGQPMWEFSKFRSDAVIINLGTNGGWRTNQTLWVEGYVKFAQRITQYYADPMLPIFLAYGPMPTSYKEMVLNITATLAGSGVHAHTLDLTLPHGMTGCYGHPSHADNIEIAAKAKPQIASVLGWK
jgi:hypothetical protein